MNYQTELHPDDKLLSFPQVIEMTGLSRSRLYDLQSRQLFPKSIKISRHRVAFLESEVRAFINGRITDRNQKFNLNTSGEEQKHTISA